MHTWTVLTLQLKAKPLLIAGNEATRLAEDRKAFRK
jgi:hypothetical protein